MVLNRIHFIKGFTMETVIDELSVTVIDELSVKTLIAAFHGAIVPMIVMFALTSISAALAYVVFAYFATRIKRGKEQARMILFFGAIIPFVASGFLILGGTAKIASMLPM
jgi:hypothetical protein